MARCCMSCTYPQRVNWPVRGQAAVPETHHRGSLRPPSAVRRQRLRPPRPSAQCNPAIKSREDRDALRRALAGNRLDVIGTDHAPRLGRSSRLIHRRRPAATGPACVAGTPGAGPRRLAVAGHPGGGRPATGSPNCSPSPIAVSSAKATGADLVLVSELEHPALASAMPLLSRCNWTPFRHRAFHHRIDTTIVSGQLAWHAGRLSDDCQGLPLRFSAEDLSTACCGYPLAHGPSAGLSPPRQGRHRSPPRDRPSPASARRSRPPPRSSPCG